MFKKYTITSAAPTKINPFAIPTKRPSTPFAVPTTLCLGIFLKILSRTHTNTLSTTNIIIIAINARAIDDTTVPTTLLTVTGSENLKLLTISENNFL